MQKNTAPVRRTYSRHGLTTLKAAVRELGPRAIDRRTRIGKQLAAADPEALRLVVEGALKSRA